MKEVAEYVYILIQVARYQLSISSTFYDETVGKISKKSLDVLVQPTYYSRVFEGIK